MQQRLPRRKQDGFRARHTDLSPVEILQILMSDRRWQDAVLLLQDLYRLGFLWHCDSGEVKRAWDAIETNSDFRIMDCYEAHIRNPQPEHQGLFELAELLAESEHDIPSAHIFDALIQRGAAHDHEQLASCLDWRARLHWNASEFDDAMRLLREEERVCRQHGDEIGLAQALNNQALLHEDRCELDNATALYKRSEQLHREQGDERGLAMNLCNQARLLSDQLQMEPALVLLGTVERLGLQTDNDEARARAFLLKAEILIDGGRLQEASECAARGHALAKRIHHIQLMNALSALVE